MAENYYDILWIDKSASVDEIKKAYRKKAMECHPDRHGWDKEMEAKFKKLGEAYAVLSDPGKKQNYDTYGSAEGLWGAWPWAWGFEVNLNDIFESVFWGGFWWFGGSQWQRTPIWDDAQVSVDISFEEAFSWVTKDIKIDRLSTCETCEWSGAEWDEKPTTCTTCNGQWQVLQQSRSMFGVVQQAVTCHDCSGTWEKITNPCKDCRGKKVTLQKEEESVDVPAGINDGMSMKIPQKWHMAPGWRAWDLYVVCNVEQSFGGLVREENTIRYIVDISPALAALWDKKYSVELPIYGKKQVAIEAGTQSWEERVFAKEWFVDVRSGRRGDLILQMRLVTPKKLSKEAKKLYEHLLEVE